VEVLPSPEQTAVLQVVVPSPAELGIRLDEASPATVVVPDPDELGINPE
jgi:hypothetical protein